jgi:hippurate hydrolase
VTQVHGGDTWNVIPDEVVLRGTTRAFKTETQDAIEAALRRVSEGVAAGMGASVAVRYERRYPALVNSEAETRVAAAVASEVAGGQNVDTDLVPTMGSEDFAFMLREKPGCYLFIGNGDKAASLHNPHYDFNDEILPLGASYWAKLVEHVLGKAA